MGVTKPNQIIVESIDGVLLLKTGFVAHDNNFIINESKLTYLKYLCRLSCFKFKMHLKVCMIFN